MELIRKLGRRFSKSGKYKQSYGIFLCSYCNKEVEKELGAGKRCRSCGCVKNKLIGEALITHGDSKNRHISKLYTSWMSMRRRCYDKNECNYKNYGGRGIVVCNEWKNDFAKFKRWALENGYRDDLTIDRINNGGNYEPSNCKWSTAKEQARNRRNNKMITYKGKIRCLSKWAEILGVKANTLNARISHYGWTIERAFTEEIHIEFRGKEK